MYREPGTRTRNSQICYRVTFFIRHVIRYDFEWTIATVIIIDIHPLYSDYTLWRSFAPSLEPIVLAIDDQANGAIA